MPVQITIELARRHGSAVALMVGSAVIAVGEGAMQVLIAPHLQQRGLADATIGPIVACFAAGSLVTRFVAGAIYRPHRVRFLLPAGCGLSAIAFVLIATQGQAVALAGAIALNGIGFSLASTCGLAAVMDASPDGNAGSVMGWYTGATGAGFALAGVVGGVSGDSLGVATAIWVLAVVPLSAGVIFGVALWRFGRSPTPVDGPRAEATAGRKQSARGSGAVGSMFRGAGPVVWLAFAVALHINLLSGVLTTYFPLLGLAIGLSLTQIGLLTGLHSSVSAAVRFATAFIFRVIDHRRLTVWLVWLGGLGVASLVISRSFLILAIGWFAIGLSRGLLRVSSAALVMESTAERPDVRGSATGLYLAGLDTGKIIGPIAGGAAVHLWGYEAAFLVAGLTFPVIYVVLSAFVRRHESRARPVGPSTQS